MHLLLTAGVVVMLVGASYSGVVLSNDDPEPGGLQEVPELDDATFHFDAHGMIDTDLDGLSDAQENFIYGSDPLNASTAGSRIPDGWLARHGQDLFDTGIEGRPAAVPPPEALPTSYAGKWPTRFVPTLWDVYSFARPAGWDEQEEGVFDNGLDPRRWDNSGDGIPDGYLLRHGLDPRDPTIADRTLVDEGLTVRQAYHAGTDPTRRDTDGDGLSDRLEIEGPVSGKDGAARFEPTDPLRWDTRGSGICDGYLVRSGLDPHAVLPGQDHDLDGATVLEEFAWSRSKSGDGVCSTAPVLDPMLQSTTGGEVPDGWLIRYGLDALDPGVAGSVTQNASTDGGPANADVEGLPDVALTVFDEYRVNRPFDWNESIQGPWWGGTHPVEQDTDGDGLGDAWELRGYTLSVSTQVGPADPAVLHTTSDPTKADTDGDGLADGIEVSPIGGNGDGTASWVLDARRRDTDFDGLIDSDEAMGGLGLDPTRADSAGDFLRDGQRLAMLNDRSSQYSHSLAYEFPGEPDVARSVLDWIHLLGGTVAGDPDGPEAVAAVFLPEGNADGDNLTNILDPDMDGDGLKNGWEMVPAFYGASAFGAGSFGDRSATDPLNPDTDGDGLFDEWEVRFGVPVRAGYNLDPAFWDSDSDGISDGQEDEDERETLWIAFSGSMDEPVPALHQFRFPNMMEQDRGTDPNRMDSDGDGLRDGWKFFWGSLYPLKSPGEVGVIYPGAPGAKMVPPDSVVPTNGIPQANEDPLGVLEYDRFVLDPDSKKAWEDEVPGGKASLNDHPSGNRVVVTKLHGKFPFTLQDAQAAGTNVYLAASLLSTDGDGMSDGWEWLRSSPLGGTTVEGEDLGACTAEGGPDPLVHDGVEDPDGDGLNNTLEYVLKTDPMCADSDLGGVSDGAEEAAGLDPTNPGDDRFLLDRNKDTDNDGISDFDELTGTGEMVRLFPRLSNAPRTDPLSPDTDGDGLLDGTDLPDARAFPLGYNSASPSDQARIQAFLDLGIAHATFHDDAGNLRFFFLGEATRTLHPLEGDDAGAGVPAGWLVGHGKKVEASSAIYAEKYRLGIPAWWDQRSHGPWWGGATPESDQWSLLRVDPDIDRDGLLDRRAGRGFEDPFPAANKANQWRPVDYALHNVQAPGPGDGPDADGITPLASRLRAQSFIDPVRHHPSPLGRGDPGPPPAQRIEPCIRVDAFPETVVLGATAQITGAVFTCGSVEPLANVTVEAFLPGAEMPVGVGFSDTQGSFTISLHATTTHTVRLPAGSIFLGLTQAEVSWQSDLSNVPLGDGGSIQLRTYATPEGHLGVPAGGLSSTQETLSPVSFRTPSHLKVSSPRDLATGSDLRVDVLLADGAGRPRQDPVEVTVNGHTRNLQWTAPGSGTAVFAKVPHAWAGSRTISVRSVPDGADGGWVEAGLNTTTVILRQPVLLEPDAPTIGADAGETVVVAGRLVPTGPLRDDYEPVDVTLRVGGNEIASSAPVSRTGHYSATLRVPAEAASGEYSIVHRIKETDRTAADETTSFIRVRSQPAFSGVTLGGIDFGQPVEVSGRLLEPDASPIVGAPVTISFHSGSENVLTAADGSFRAQFPPGFPLAPVAQSLDFGGDGQRTPAAHHAQRQVSSATSISMLPGKVDRGAEAAVSAVLSDGAGGPVPRGVVDISWGGQLNFSVLTNSSGAAVALVPVPEDAPLGAHRVIATFNGSRDGSLRQAAAAAEWQVVSRAAFELPNLTIDVGSQPPVARLVEAATGTPIVGAHVRVREGHTPGTNRTEVTNSEGAFPLIRDVPAVSSPPTKIPLNLSFDGAGKHEPLSASHTLQIRAKPVLSWSPPLTLVIGRQTLIEASVTEQDEAPVEGGRLAVLLGTTELGAGDVHNGSARLAVQVPNGTLSGPTVITLAYSGDDEHVPGTTEASIRMTSAAHLRIEVRPASRGGDATLEVQATRDGVPLPLVPVYLIIQGRPSGLKGQTDENGRVTFGVPESNQTTRVAARFDGDATTAATIAYAAIPPHRDSSAGSDARAWLLAGAALAMASAAAGAYWYQRRRNVLEQAFRLAHRALLDFNGSPKERILAAYERLEDAAIGHGLLDGPAMTPGSLAESVAAKVPPAADPHLRDLITLFEHVRYSPAEVRPIHAQAAQDALQHIVQEIVRAAAWSSGAVRPEASA